MGCQAIAHRYVGKGKDRELFTGPCVLDEVGHDGDHLPASLAYRQQYDMAYNAAIDDVIANESIDWKQHPEVATAIQAMRRT